MVLLQVSKKNNFFWKNSKEQESIKIIIGKGVIAE